MNVPVRYWLPGNWLKSKLVITLIFVIVFIVVWYTHLDGVIDKFPHADDKALEKADKSSYTYQQKDDQALAKWEFTHCTPVAKDCGRLE